MNTFTEDYRTGLDNEERILNILKQKFNDTENKIRLNPDNFGFYDIIDEINERFYEIKTKIQ